MQIGEWFKGERGESGPVPSKPLLARHYETQQARHCLADKLLML